MSSNRKKLPIQRKTCAHPQKIMLYIWWNSEGVLYYELFPRGVTITADIHCQQRNKRKRPTRLHEVHYNARPHSANLTISTTQELGWEVIPHPPYSPDLAPSDFQVFRSLWNNLPGTSRNFKMCSVNCFITS